MQTRPAKIFTVGLYLNAALLAAVLVVLLTRSNTPSMLPMALGQAQPPIGGGAGVFVMPGQFAEKTWGCYLLDVDSQSLCAYQYFPGEKQLRLIAVRNYKYDRKLSNFNTDHPTPLEVKDLLDKESRNPPSAVDAPAAAPALPGTTGTTP
jgi:hypothetical protein